jgi:hypothetical protein
MVRVFKKILRDRRRDRRLYWADNDADRWFRLRRRPVDEPEEPPAILDERRDERGGSSFLFARADGGAVADFRLAPSRGGAAPNKRDR